MDVVGPRSLQGDSTRYYFLVLRDTFDLAVYLELVESRKMAGILAFLTRAWQQLGLPHQVQFENGREFGGFGPGARSLSHVSRFCLRVGGEPVFLPKRRPAHNGTVEQFNGWFQPVLLNRPYRRPADLRRELRRLMTSVHEQHGHPQLGQRTSAQYRRSKRLRKLPADFTLEGQPLPVAVGKVSFIRLVSAQGTSNILEQPYRVGKRLTFQYVKATIFTREQTMKVYSRGRVVKALRYQLTGQ